MFEAKDVNGKRIRLITADRMTITGTALIFEKVTTNGNITSSQYVTELPISKGMSIVPIAS